MVWCSVGTACIVLYAVGQWCGGMAVFRSRVSLVGDDPARGASCSARSLQRGPASRWRSVGSDAAQTQVAPRGKPSPIAVTTNDAPIQIVDTQSRNCSGGAVAAAAAGWWQQQPQGAVDIQVRCWHTLGVLKVGFYCLPAANLLLQPTA